MKAKQMTQKFGVLFVLAVLTAGSNAWAGDPFKGRTLYDKHCANCHGLTGRSQLPNVPDFTRGQALVKPDATLRTSVQNGSPGMPGYLGILKETEIEDVITYIRTLR